MVQNVRVRRGSPADSMLSGTSGGGTNMCMCLGMYWHVQFVFIESTLDFSSSAPRERMASNVVSRLKVVALSSRSRSKSTPERERRGK